MLRITTHIEKLLLTHDCVIISGVGGFVLQTVSSQFNKEEHSFQPMYKELVFNSALQHNDGLLAESYMQTYQVAFEKAQSMVEEDIAEIKNTLKQYNKVALGQIGSLTQGTEGQLIFQSGKANVLDADHYGLSTFHFPLLPAVVVSESTPAETIIKRKRDIFYIPVNMRLVRGVVASAAAIALFCLISTPVKDVEQSAYTASIIPREMLTIRTSDDTATSAVQEEEIVSVPAPVVEAPVTPPAIQQKMYHIVIGSFPNQAKADEYMETIDKTLYQESGLIVRDDRYRVYARKFDNRKEAESYLSIIRDNEKYKDAWLFISR